MQSLTQKITDTVAERANPDSMVTDSVTTGLKLRVSPKGKKSWYAKFRHNGKWYMKKLGGYPAFRTAEIRQVFEVYYKQILTEKAPEISKSYTLKEMLEESLAVKKVKGRKDKTLVDYERYRKFILKVWGEGLDVKSITPKMCEKLHSEYPSPTQANRMLNFLRMCFNRANDLDIVDHNPAKKVERNREKVRGVNATIEDLRKLIDYAAEYERPECSLFLYVLTLSGARVEQVKLMTWTDVHDEVWFKKGEDAKNHMDSTVFLGADLVEKLKGLGNEYLVFGNWGHRNSWERVRAACGMDQVRLHDIRKIMGTHLINGGYDMKKISSWLQHSNSQVTERHYAHFKSDFRDLVEDVKNLLPLSLCR